MTRSEAINQIDKITSNFETFKGQNNKLIDMLDSIVGDLNAINYQSINHNTTISLIENSYNTIGNNIDKVVDNCDSAVNTAANDANKKMEEIASAYNSSITEDDVDQTRVTFSKVEGNPKRTINLKKGKRGGNTSGGSNYDAPPEETAPSVTETLNYYFAHASQEKLNSSEIDGWDDYIKEFLEENGLSEYVTSIKIVDGVIICKLFNDKEYKYENVTGIVDLLKQLKESLSKESGENE